MGCRCGKVDFRTSWSAKAEEEPLVSSTGLARGSIVKHPALEGVVEAAAGRLGRAGVSGRYHRLPRRLEEDYIVEDSVLGSGFNGDVLRARGRHNGMPFAVKAFRLQGVSRETMKVLKTEAEIFLMMDHPHIARLTDVYEGDKFLHLVMECMEGGELFDRLTRLKKFSESDAADALYQMLLAVNYMHTRGVVHRDLKLENFLYERQESDHLKLIDFGFSHTFERSDTVAGSCGTLPYAAPEVLEGKAYGCKCDLWSLGVVAFILLAGYMPFSGPWPQMVANIKAGKWVEKPHRWERISGSAKHFVRSLLQVSPDQRLSAAEALDHPFLMRGVRLSRKISEQSIGDTEVLTALREFGQASRFRRAAMSLMAWSLNSREMAQVRDAFLQIDANRQGTITLGELKNALSGCFDITDDQVKPIFEALDTGANAEIYYSEFLAAMVSKRIEINEELLRATFQRFDVDKSGYITVANLKEVLGDSFDGVKVEELIKEADYTNDGQISLDEFIRYLKVDGLGAAAQVIDKAQIVEPVAERQRRRSRISCKQEIASPTSPASPIARLASRACFSCEASGCAAGLQKLRARGG